ncbi:hypothetical protein ES708_24316 [subsurface metagenome]
MPVQRWFAKTIAQEDTPDGFTITITTDIPCHLWLYWTDKTPWTHPKGTIDRGLAVKTDSYWCFVAWHKIEQNEAGDTLIHTFSWPGWEKCQTKYFRFHGEIADEESVSDSPIHKKHKTEEVPEMYVISLGKLTEEEVLHGHVKLEEGERITLTRNDENNSLIIAADEPEPTPYLGFGDHWLVIPSAHPDHDVHSWDYDRFTIGVSYEDDNLRVHTGSMKPWDYRAPHTISFAAIRDVAATMRPTTYSAMVDDTTDLHNNRAHRHIAFIERDNKVYASCGDGPAFTEVEISALGYYFRHWLKWTRTATGVEFYVNGVLKTTITTNVPNFTNNCRFLFQMIGTYDAVRYVDFTQPFYLEGENGAVDIGEGHTFILARCWDSIGQGNFSHHTTIDQYLANYLRGNGNVDGDNISYKAYLAAGTYTLLYCYLQTPMGGIVDIDINGSEVGSVDTYNANTRYNQFYKVTGIVIPSAGLKTIRLRVDGRNPSADYYFLPVCFISLWRTA